MGELQEQINGLKEQIDQIRTKNGDLAQKAMTTLTVENNKFPELSTRKMLKGHFAKVYACDWSSKESKLVSASQDGKLIIWNARSQNKVLAIPLRSSWVMGCAYEKEQNEFVACGGLDNLCSIYKLKFDGSPVERPNKELSGHDGYVSSCKFINGSKEIITASGDSTIMLWDTERGENKAVFDKHSGDVMSLSVSPVSNDVIVSGSCDGSARLWDVRAKDKFMGTFTGHESDVNGVAFFPDGNAFASASDDSTMRLWDIRSQSQLNSLGTPKILCGISTVDFSKSGRIIFGGYDDHCCYAWDALNTKEEYAYKLAGHENRVSCVSVNTEGDAVATGSWDATLRVWA